MNENSSFWGGALFELPFLKLETESARSNFMAREFSFYTRTRGRVLGERHAQELISQFYKRSSHSV